MPNRRPTAALAAALLLAAAPLAAQPAPAALPDTGARVRVVLVDRHRVVGTLVAREPGRWLVRRARGDTVAVTPLAVERLDVSLGRRSVARAFWRGAGVGALVGGGVTAVGFGVLAASGNLRCTDCFFPPVLVVGIGGTALTVGTTLVGGVIGSFVRERWTSVPLPAETRVGVVAVPGGAGVGVRLALP